MVTTCGTLESRVTKRGGNWRVFICRRSFAWDSLSTTFRMSPPDVTNPRTFGRRALPAVLSGQTRRQVPARRMKPSGRCRGTCAVVTSKVTPR